MMLHEFQARLAQLQRSNPGQKLFMLVDGLLYQQYHEDMPLSTETGAIALLQGTQDDSLSDAGPWLVAPELAGIQLCQSLERLEHAAPSVSWIIAPYDIDSLASMLRERLNIRLPDGRAAMLRFWDPRVLASIARHLDAIQRQDFFATSSNGIYCLTDAVCTLLATMLTLTEKQYQQFVAVDEQNFVVAVADQLLSKPEDMLTEPGRAEIVARMRAAYDNGINLGFTSTGHLIYMMYMAADYPGLFERPMAQRYLLKPGATPEQRLDEMKAILGHVATTARQREEESQQ